MTQQTPERGGRLAVNLERLYRGVSAALGWAVQPLAWLADFIKRDPEQTARWWRRNYMRPIFWLAVPLTPFWIVVILLVGMNLIDQLVSDIPIDPVERRTWYYGIGLTITGLGALLAAPFILIKAWVNERTTTAAEQGLITERFTRAVEQLGAEKTVKFKDEDETTAPNIEVRLGAIYALERIARDSERDHVPVMETLCAYIRENARTEPPRDFPLSDFAAVEGETAFEQGERMREAMAEFFGEAQPLRADIQAVFSVIARRTERQREIERESDPPFRLDLRRANLQSLDLTEVDLRGADLCWARLEGAVLTGAQLERADLSQARLQASNLYQARMDKVYLCQASLECASLVSARLNDAVVDDAYLDEAHTCDIMWEQSWSCERTRLRSVDFTKVRVHDPGSLNTAFGVLSGYGQTLLPKEASYPEHWHVAAETDEQSAELWQALDQAFEDDYRAWLAAGCPTGAEWRDGS